MGFYQISKWAFLVDCSYLLTREECEERFWEDGFETGSKRLRDTTLSDFKYGNLPEYDSPFSIDNLCLETLLRAFGIQ